jgi:hypothetical protein
MFITVRRHHVLDAACDIDAVTIFTIVHGEARLPWSRGATDAARARGG